MEILRACRLVNINGCAQLKDCSNELPPSRPLLCEPFKRSGSAKKLLQFARPFGEKVSKRGVYDRLSIDLEESGWPHSNLVRMVATLSSQGYVDEPWRIIAHKFAKAGDRVWLLKQGRGRREYLVRAKLLDHRSGAMSATKKTVDGASALCRTG
jgi:hypothetical protein